MPKMLEADFKRLREAFEVVSIKNPPRKHVSLQLARGVKITYNQVLENYFHFCAAVDTGLDVDLYRKYNDVQIQNSMKRLFGPDVMGGGQ